MALTTTQIQNAYVAFFNRPADVAGLNYWSSYQGSSLDLLSTFAQSAEYKALYAGLSTDNAVNQVYLNLFGRKADVDGLNYWVGQINAQKLSMSNLADAINKGSQGTDLTAVTNKTKAAVAFTEALDTTEEVVSYSQLDADKSAAVKQWMSGITDDASLTTGTSAATLTALTTAISGTQSNGSTVSLTSQTDKLTANNFTADLVYTPGGNNRVNALQDEDSLTGIGTNPTLTATLGNANDNGGTIITPKLNNIQTLNVSFTGSGTAGIVSNGAVTDLDLQDATGLQAINVNRISQAVNTAEVGNIMTAAAALSLSNTNSNNAGTVEFSYGNNVLKGDNTGSLALSNVQVNTLNVGQNTSGIGARGVGTNGFETLNLASNGAAANTVGTLNLPMDTGTAGKLVVTGAADLTLGARTNVVNAANAALAEASGLWTAASGLAQPGGRLVAVDASAMTGKLNMVIDNLLDIGKADTSGVLQNVAITGGKGDDTFALFDTVQNGDTINGGDGNDTLVMGATAALAGTVSKVENLQFLINGGAASADYKFLPDVTATTVRNVGNAAGTNNPLAGPVTATLTGMNAAQAAGITVQHSTTGNNAITDTTLVTAVGTNTASDTVGVTIAEGLNVDPRFNFSLSTAIAGNASTIENVKLTDSDTESNSVELTNFAQHTGTITLTGGQAGTFLNLDVNTVAVAAAKQGALGLDVSELASDNAAGVINDNAALATMVRLGAATIDASAEASDVIVRLGTNANDVNGAQTITGGSGNDTVIFDNLNDATAGLSISDKVTGGAGTDTLAIDGNGVKESLGASEWTNVTGFETLRLIGNGSVAAGTIIGQNSYNITLTNTFIAANQGSNGLLAVVNDNDSANDVAAVGTVGMNTAGSGLESGVTIDARSLSATTHFSYNGEEGSWFDLNGDGVAQAAEALAGGTVDKFIFADANVNGGNVIDGGAQDNVAATFGGNSDVLEIRNGGQATTGDLANIKNVGIIAGSNDSATANTLVLQLNDAIIDSMVDSYHTATSAEREVLTVRMNNALDVAAVAREQLDMDVSQTTIKSMVNVTLDVVGPTGARDNVKLGMGQVNITNFDSGPAASQDTITLSAAQFGLAAAAVGTTVTGLTAVGTNVVFGALGTGALTDRVYVVEGAPIAGQGAPANDIGIYYDADGSGAAAAVLVGVLVDTALSTLSGGSGLTIVA